MLYAAQLAASKAESLDWISAMNQLNVLQKDHLKDVITPKESPKEVAPQEPEPVQQTLPPAAPAKISREMSTQVRPFQSPIST